NRRMGDLETLKKEISAWETNRNLNTKSVDWHFTTDDARGRLKSLYPKI
ncbi:MAG: IS630 family transposase, partial [Desulfovibrio sp.]|nr:IS630 family transposase [Desulfovibrio sp.]